LISLFQVELWGSNTQSIFFTTLPDLLKPKEKKEKKEKKERNMATDKTTILITGANRGMRYPILNFSYLDSGWHTRTQDQMCGLPKKTPRSQALNTPNTGIGQGLVELYLARPNHTVIGSVRDPSSEQAQSLHTLPSGPNTTLILVKIDSTSETDAAAAVSELTKNHGITTLDVVIANAGIANIFSRVEDIKPADLRALFEVNTLGVLWLLQAAYPLLKAAADEREKEGDATTKKGPMFIGLSTQAATLQDLEANTPFLLGAYGASKIAMNYLVRRMHFESPWLTAFLLDPGYV
jgi:norsolorinic acid ketoreductase